MAESSPSISLLMLALAALAPSVAALGVLAVLVGAGSGLAELDLADPPGFRGDFLGAGVLGALGAANWGPVVFGRGGKSPGGGAPPVLEYPFWSFGAVDAIPVVLGVLGVLGGRITVNFTDFFRIEFSIRLNASKIKLVWKRKRKGVSGVFSRTLSVDRFCARSVERNRAGSLRSFLLI